MCVLSIFFFQVFSHNIAFFHFQEQVLRLKFGVSDMELLQFLLSHTAWLLTTCQKVFNNFVVRSTLKHYSLFHILGHWVTPSSADCVTLETFLDRVLKSMLCCISGLIRYDSLQVQSFSIYPVFFRLLVALFVCMFFFFPGCSFLGKRILLPPSHFSCHNYFFIVFKKQL